MTQEIKAFILKNGSPIIGKFNEELNSLDDILQLTFFKYSDGKGGVGESLCAAPIGYPINQKEVTLSFDKLDILFELKDNLDKFKEVYERDLLIIQNPGIIQPQSKIIVH